MLLSIFYLANTRVSHERIKRHNHKREKSIQTIKQCGGLIHVGNRGSRPYDLSTYSLWKSQNAKQLMYLLHGIKTII